METKVYEIADGIFRISTLVSAINPPLGFSFNQFLIKAEQPFLFHCGHRKMFPAIAAAVARILPLDQLRWVSFSHVEADECGALETWLDAARIVLCRGRSRSPAWPCRPLRAQAQPCRGRERPLRRKG
jgi:flavorubredoxin